MIKRVIIVILAFALVMVGGVLGGCDGDMSSDAVAKVGDVVIKEDMLNERTQELAPQYGVADQETDPDTWEAFRYYVLDYLVTYQIAAQKADEYDVSVTDDEVQQEIDLIVDTYYDGDEDTFAETLAEYGMTLEQLKTSYKESMLIQKVYDKVTEDITEVSDEEIAAYYEENKDSFWAEETRTARHILIAPGNDDSSNTSTTDSVGATTTTELTEADWDAALAKAKEVRAKLVAGGDWKELAATYSDDPGSAEAGGDLGEIKKNEQVAEVEDAIFSLELNEISEPVKSPYGYHIIQVTEITPAHQLTLDEVKDSIASQLLAQKKQQAWLDWLEAAKLELDVTYREDMQTTTTTVTTESETSATAAPDGNTSSTVGQTIDASDTSASTTAITTTTTVKQP